MSQGNSTPRVSRGVPWWLWLIAVLATAMVVLGMLVKQSAPGADEVWKAAVRMFEVVMLSHFGRIWKRIVRLAVTLTEQLCWTGSLRKERIEVRKRSRFWNLTSNTRTGNCKSSRPGSPALHIRETPISLEPKISIKTTGNYRLTTPCHICC